MLLIFFFFFFRDNYEECRWKDLKFNLCLRSMTDNGNFRHSGKKDSNYSSLYGRFCIKDSCRSYLLDGGPENVI